MYQEKATISKHSLPEAPQEGRRGTNNDTVAEVYRVKHYFFFFYYKKIVDTR